MSTKSSIEWTDYTWNPVTGCTKVSQGCKHCYAERLFPKVYPGRPFTEVRCHPERLQQPLRMTKGCRIFVNSMSDLFHEDVPFEFIDQVFAVMACTTRHKYQILTKRPARMLEWFNRLRNSVDETYERWQRLDVACGWWPEQVQPTDVWPKWVPYIEGKRGGYDNCGPLWPLENVWLGVSVEDQATADERIPLLLQTPATVRWISAEPLLGPVDVRTYLEIGNLDRGLGEPGLDWVVTGGESGPKARPSHPDWFRSLRDQCDAAGVPFLFKQWGEWHPESSANYATGRNEYRYGKVAGLSMMPSGAICLLNTAEAPAGFATIVDAEAMRVWHDRCARSEGKPDADNYPFGYQWMQRIGKKAAGRTLDGRIHDEYPDV